MATKVHRVVLMIIDHDGLGEAGVREVLENARYPNHCMAPTVVTVETREVEWADDHPLNRPGHVEHFRQMFGDQAGGDDD